MPSPPSRDSATAREVRDCLAEEFAVAVSDEQGAVVEILEQQLLLTEDHTKWRPIRQAIDALRDVAPRLRGELEKRVRTRIDAKLSPGSGQFSETQRFSLDTLSLVPEDEVQEEIAIGNVARRLREATSEEFFALNTRLQEVLGGKSPDEESPVHARIFARALLDVLVDSGAEAGTRIAAFHAFDPAMLHALPRTYKSANEMLVKRGVLPELKRSFGAPRQVPGARASMHGMAGASPDGLVAQAAPAPIPPPMGLFDRLLASAANPAARAAPAAPVAAPPAAAQAAGFVTLQVRPELVEALRNLEARLASDPDSVAVLAPAPPGAEAQVSGRSPDVVLRARDEMAGSLTPPDVLVADLVAALFRRLFADPEVSDAAKLQLAGLQLPVFKAVMADRSFFTEPAHPVRGLIDVIAELGASGDSFHIDGKLPQEWVEEETRSLLEAGKIDTAAFEAARDRLRAVTARHHEVLADFDSIVRTVRREDVERSAVRDASLEVAHRAAASDCTKEAADFVYRAWRPVLTHVHRTLGDSSEQWRTDLATLDGLLWVLSPRAAARERDRLAEAVPAVRFQLWRGLIRSRFASAEIEALLAEFDRLQGEVQRAPLAAAQAELTTTVALARTVEEDFTATLHVSLDAMRDEGFVRGAWFEFKEEDGTRRRARIAWASPIQGACVFKDVARNRSFAISLADLRAKIDQGLAMAADGPGVATSSVEGALLDVARERGSASNS